jgi:hypothetical protein
LEVVISRVVNRLIFNFVVAAVVFDKYCVHVFSLVETSSRVDEMLAPPARHIVAISHRRCASVVLVMANDIAPKWGKSVPQDFRYRRMGLSLVSKTVTQVAPASFGQQVIAET